MADITYTIGNSLYLNITNRCTNQCEFCIRYKSKNLNQQYSLWLDKEPTVEEIIAAIGEVSKYQQIVFCGYGEPTIRLDAIKQIATQLKQKNAKIRLDTNGLANLFWGRNILPELKGLIDFVSVSLNADNPEVYDRICSPVYRRQAFAAVIEFVREAKLNIPQVEITVVDLPIVDIDKCREIAKQLDVSFRVRPYYEENYVR
jgi:TatD family-associated radical SAM protein